VQSKRPSGLSAEVWTCIHLINLVPSPSSALNRKVQAGSGIGLWTIGAIVPCALLYLNVFIPRLIWYALCPEGDCVSRLSIITVIIGLLFSCAREREEGLSYPAHQRSMKEPLYSVKRIHNSICSMTTLKTFGRHWSLYFAQSSLPVYSMLTKSTCQQHVNNPRAPPMTVATRGWLPPSDNSP
jgi:hypothetical protein